jgi:hypothetical protein
MCVVYIKADSTAVVLRKVIQTGTVFSMGAEVVITSSFSNNVFDLINT